MTFRVYNQNGKVKVTKVCQDNVERPMFSDIPDGEFVEIETHVTQCSKSRKKKIGGQDLKLPAEDISEEDVFMTFGRSIMGLECAIKAGIDYEDEVRLAIGVLKSVREYGPKSDLTEQTEELVKKKQLLGKQITYALFTNVLMYQRFMLYNGMISEDEADSVRTALLDYARNVMEYMGKKGEN